MMLMYVANGKFTVASIYTTNTDFDTHTEHTPIICHIGTGFSIGSSYIWTIRIFTLASDGKVLE